LRKAGQHPLGGLQFSELLGQFRPVAVELGQPFGDQLAFFCDVVEGGHLLSLPDLANRGHSFSVRRVAQYMAEKYAKKRATARFCAIQAGQCCERMPLKQPIIGASPTEIALLRSQ
jgi:hypothetical protein